MTITKQPPERLTGRLYVYWHIEFQFIMVSHKPWSDDPEIILLDDTTELDIDLSGAADMIELHKAKAVKAERERLLAELAKLDSVDGGGS